MTLPSHTAPLASARFDSWRERNLIPNARLVASSVSTRKVQTMNRWAVVASRGRRNLPYTSILIIRGTLSSSWKAV